MSCRLFIEARAQANHCDVEGKSPLILAAGVGASNVCQLLLDSKALVDGEKLGYIGKNEAQEEGYPSPSKKEDLDLCCNMVYDCFNV